MESKRERKLDPRYPPQGAEVVFNGMKFPAPTTPEHLASLENFTVRPSDWFVITYPKSGTTWMQEIMALLRDGNTNVADSSLNMVRVPFIEALYPPELPVDLDGPGQRVLKSHFPDDMVPKQIWEKKPKIVVVFRDPRDVAVSLMHMYRALSMVGWEKGFSAFLEMFMAGQAGWGNWFDWVQGWWKVKDDSHMLFITYEWMLNNHKEAVEKVAKFLGKDSDADFLDVVTERTSFTSMKQHPMINGSNVPTDVIDVKKSPFFRKGKSGDWKNYFTVAESERFDELYKERMKGFEDLDAFLKEI